ncbi:HAD-IA family hydrolase [Bacillus timonensis]|uniref:HAD-IA family hydrolase n=1 Tax=Bacillus timonensis TaxID=1033734 RepID=UPI000288F7AB|nr:HAD-IA family hydrolase [Bacillus timonensis]
MQEKVNLVLDIAGVIATNYSPIFWKNLSTQFNVPHDKLLEFKKEFRHDLWTGKIGEGRYWYLLTKRFPTIDIEYARNSLLSMIKPLPALDHIPRWSIYATIHLVSNHRREWLNHIIEPIQNHINSITISSEVGFSKPNNEIFVRVANQISQGARILFIDDQEKNLNAAKILGWSTILADKNGEWIRETENLLVSSFKRMPR